MVNGGHLASINSAEELESIQTLISETMGTSESDFWVGGSDREVNNQWQWTDNSSWDFSGRLSPLPPPIIIFYLQHGTPMPDRAEDQTNLFNTTVWSFITFKCSTTSVLTVTDSSVKIRASKWWRMEMRLSLFLAVPCPFLLFKLFSNLSL